MEQPKNALADSVEPAEDGLSLTVHLKKDVKWSDGEAFTAEDVVFTYEQKVKKKRQCRCVMGRWKTGQH